MIELKVGAKIALVFIVISAVLGGMTFMILNVKTSVDDSQKELRNSFKQVETAINNTSKIHELSSQIEEIFSKMLEIPFLKEENLVDEKKAEIEKDISVIEPKISLVSVSTKQFGNVKDILNKLIDYQKKFIKYEINIDTTTNKMLSRSRELQNSQKRREEFFKKDEKKVAKIKQNVQELSKKYNGAQINDEILKEIASEINKMDLSSLSIPEIESMFDSKTFQSFSMHMARLNRMKSYVLEILVFKNKDVIENDLQKLEQEHKDLKSFIDMNLKMSMGLTDPVELIFLDKLVGTYIEKVKDLITLEDTITMQQESLNNFNNIAKKMNTDRNEVLNKISNLISRDLSQLKSDILSKVDNAMMAQSDKQIQSIANARKATDDVEKSFKNVVRSLFIFLVILAAAIIVGGIFLTLNFTRILKNLTSVAQKISEGDLSVNVEKTKRRDQFGQLQNAFVEMIKNLRDIISNTKDASDSMASHAENVSTSIEENSASMQEIAANMNNIKNAIESAVTSLRNTSMEMEKLRNESINIQKSANEITDKSIQSQQLAKNTEERLLESNKVTNETIKVIERSAQEINQLDQTVGEIENFVEIISSIAEQTNLLALNAAIEAARAGEAGRGFAVVADEIRKLAEESNQAAENISSLLKNIVERTKEVTEVVNSGISKVTEVTKISEQSVENVEKLVDTFENFARLVNEFINYIEQQNRSIEEISGTSGKIVDEFENTYTLIDSVNTSVTENSKAMEELAKISTELTSISDRLNEIVKRFKI